jgi:FG-GAP-like repeat
VRRVAACQMMRVSRRHMLVLTSIAAGMGLLAAARAAWADAPTPTALQPTPEPSLATFSTPTILATPAAVATVAPGPQPTSLLAAAAALGLDASKVTLPHQYPTWNDGMGWAQPSQYTTIQLADIDGDGRAELIARGRAGLEAQRWSGPGWGQLAAADGVMADADGWAEPRSYLTIQAADVDGDGRFAIVGHASDGVQTWKWSGNAGAAQPADLANGRSLHMGAMLPARADEASPTAAASVVATLLAALTPAATPTATPAAVTAPLAPLSPANMPTASPTAEPTATSQPGQAITLAAPLPPTGFRATATNGFYQPVLPGFPDYSNNPGQLQSYRLISQYLLTPFPTWPPSGRRRARWARPPRAKAPSSRPRRSSCRRSCSPPAIGRWPATTWCRPPICNTSGSSGPSASRSRTCN